MSEDLIEAAAAIRSKACGPWSSLQVGAAPGTPTHAIYPRCHGEGASHAEGTSPEAGAIAAMVGAGETVIVEVASIADAPRPFPSAAASLSDGRRSLRPTCKGPWL